MHIYIYIYIMFIVLQPYQLATLFQFAYARPSSWQNTQRHFYRFFPNTYIKKQFASSISYFSVDLQDTFCLKFRDYSFITGHVIAQAVSRQPLTGESPFLFQARSYVNVVDKMALNQAILLVLMFSIAFVNLTIFLTIDYLSYVILAMTV